MPRRTPGHGSIYKRVRTRYGRKEVRWLAQLSSGGRGNRRYRVKVCQTYAEAKEALVRLRDDAERPSTSWTLGQYLRSWLSESAGPSVRPNTRRGYEDAIAHLAPIADIRLDELTAEDIERCCNGMTSQRHGQHKPVPASPKTIRNVQVMLRRALSVAEERGHVRRNVAKLVPLRSVPRIRREALTPERARAILAAMKGDRYEAAIALALNGMRVGEVLGLLWSDLDLDLGVANIRAELSGSGRLAKRVPTKTAGSAAPVVLGGFAVRRLEAHRRAQDAERPRDTPEPIAGRDGLVFVTERGYPVNGSWLTRHFAARLAAAELPTMRLHDLRHGAASLLAASGAQQKVAQQLLRHASSRTTTDIYTHVTAAQMREAADRLDALLDGTVTGTVTSSSQSVVTSGIG